MEFLKRILCIIKNFACSGISGVFLSFSFQAVTSSRYLYSIYFRFTGHIQSEFQQENVWHIKLYLLLYFRSQNLSSGAEASTVWLVHGGALCAEGHLAKTSIPHEGTTVIWRATPSLFRRCARWQEAEIWWPLDRGMDGRVQSLPASFK